MAQSQYDGARRGLRKLDTHADEHHYSNDSTNTEQSRYQRPKYHGSHPSEDTIRATATPPIEIPGQYDEVAIVESASSLHQHEKYLEDFSKDRQVSIQFEDAANLPSRPRHSVPIGASQAPAHHVVRGRSLAQALADYQRVARAHSESDRSHYDPKTGKELPDYSESPPKEYAHIGEARFPLLQQTVDALARGNASLPQPMSLTSDSTMSPVEEAVVTPSDSFSSPTSRGISLFRNFSTSFESPRPRGQRKASERWRDGEAAQDFFSRAGSLKRGDRQSTRRDTQSSTKSPTSAASSFLKSFSMGSAGDEAPAAVDGEGATVGEDYVLGKQIGYGGFSIIREVKQISPQDGTQRTLAVKIVRKQISGKSKEDNDTAQAEFEHEVDLWRLLNHKHILSLEAVYELNEATFCFIPLNTGGTLFDVMSNNRQGLDLDLAINYSYQLASALRYLHLDARVVHRDIKLENCLVDTTRGEPGLLRLCDFGLAEWISSDGDSVGSGSSDTGDRERERPLNKYFGPADSSSSAFAGGSLEYAAPEILRIATSSSGRVGKNDPCPEKSIVSPAVDIWAMGVCIYSLLLGRRPFQDAFQPRVVVAILAGDWNQQDLLDRAGEDAFRVTEKCLTMDSQERPSIREIISDPWFDDARSSAEGSDAESESARATGWRL